MAEHIVFVENVELEPLQCFLVPGELVQVVPAHGVEVGLADLTRQDGLVPVQKRKEILELEEVLLLDDLGIDIGRSQRLDLGDEKVSYSLDGLGRSALCP